MTLTLDDFEYLENDYMNISGSLPNFDSNADIYYQVVSLLISILLMGPL